MASSAALSSPVWMAARAVSSASARRAIRSRISRVIPVIILSGLLLRGLPGQQLQLQLHEAPPLGSFLVGAGLRVCRRVSRRQETALWRAPKGAQVNLRASDDQYSTAGPRGHRPALGEFDSA